MSYSRWSNSTWYTYWSAASPETNYKWPTRKLKNQQVFEICDMPSFRFTYGDLEKWHMRGLLSKVKKFYSKKHKGQILKDIVNGESVYEDTIYPAKNPTEDELRELVGYVRAWQKDVDTHFVFWVYVKYEWWQPVYNRIINSLNKLKIRL